MADTTTKEDEPVENADIHFEPIVKLPEVETKSLEDEEEEMLKLRSKMFRYDTSSSEDGPEWKERGVGDVKILKHKVNGKCRLLMRRDKTLKICANHYISPEMKLNPNCNSDRAWVWNVPCDFADEEPKPELLAIRFGNAENAQKFKSAFEEAQKLMADLQSTDSPAKGDTENSKEEANNSVADSEVQSGGDAEPASKDDDKKGGDSAGSEKDTDNVTDKLNALSVGETKSKDAAESEGSPGAER